MLGENIKYARLKKDYSQSDLIKQIELLSEARGTKSFNKNQLSKWENNLSKPSLENLYKISIATNTSMDELYSGDYVADLSHKMYEYGKLIATRVQKQYLQEEMEILASDTNTENEKMMALTSCYLKGSSRNDEGLDFSLIETIILNDKDNSQEKTKVRNAVFREFLKGVQENGTM